MKGTPAPKAPPLPVGGETRIVGEVTTETPYHKPQSIVSKINVAGRSFWENTPPPGEKSKMGILVFRDLRTTHHTEKSHASRPRRSFKAAQPGTFMLRDDSER